ncbi:sensor histidine kinase [Roseomonas sp. BN140053]|uniref:sensor histidine kinase n=1 Tax=Roseomonas sp. BN140053 TaxID=3391898 RepID=UPI0039E7732A
MQPIDHPPSGGELAVRLRQQQLVAAFGLFALREDDLQSTLQEACRVAAEGMRTSLAKVLEWLPGEQMLLMRAGVGWRPGVVGHALFGADDRSPAGHAFRTGEPVISNHLDGENRFRTPAVLAEHGVKRAINVLVEDGKQPFGVLEADATDREDFADHDTSFLQTLAATLGAVVRRHAKHAESLREKDLMMLEVHHRVKNSLQLVQNLLSLQARAAKGTEAASQLGESAARVRTIGAIHDRLYRSGAALEVEVGPYLQSLLDDMSAAMGSTLTGRSLELDVAAMTWAVADVPNLGLTVTELVTNAMKYGEGTIRVTLREQDDGRILLAVEDEGRGLPADFDPAAVHGLGMRLIRGLVRDGRVEVDRHAGHTRFLVHLTRSHAPT